MAKPRTIRILKPGTFTDIRGKTVTFAQADLDGIIAAYNAESDPAPLVVGHPTTDAPAYGWVASLAMEDGHLVAVPDRIEPAFAEAVEAGRYAKVSPQLYPPASPANPVPGSYYLQHVGFLGGAAPAIKGMGTVAFADRGADLITLAFSDHDMTTTPPTAPADAIAFAEREAAIQRREEAVAASELAITQRERDERHAANVAFAEGLIADVKLAPVAKDRVVGLLDLLDAAQPVAFGESEADTMTPHVAFRSLLVGAHPLVALGEFAGTDRAAPAADVSPDQLATRALTFQQSRAAEGVSITIQAAVRHVQANPDA